jgi:hypothetical protein
LASTTITVWTLQTMLGSEGLTGLINDLAPPEDLPIGMPRVQGAGPLDGIDRDLLATAGSTGLGVARLLATSGLASGAVGATEIGGASTAVATAGTAGEVAATGAAGLSLGPAVVIGIFVGAAVVGVRAYERYKAEQVRRAGDAVERAVVAAKEILEEFRTQTEALGKDAAVLVELRLTERGRDLHRSEEQQDAQQRTGVAELDEIRADLERLQNERARLRSAVAAGLSG